MKNIFSSSSIISGILTGMIIGNFIIGLQQGNDIDSLQHEVKKFKKISNYNEKNIVMNDVGHMMQHENDMSNDYSIQDDTLTITMKDVGSDSTGPAKHTISDTFIIPSEAISKATKYNFNIEFYFEDSKGDSHLLYSDYYNNVVFIAKNTFVR